MKIFAICDSEPGYARKLAERMTQESDRFGMVQVFDSPDSVLECNKRTNIDALLINEKVFFDISTNALFKRIEISGIDKIFILSSEKSVSGTIFGYRSFYKYQSASSLVKEILQAYGIASAQKKHRVLNMNKKVELIGIFAPISSVEKTIWALLAGMILSKERTVLYMNMERYAGFDSILGRQHTGDLSDLFYILMHEEEESEMYKSLFERYKGLSYIPPIRFGQELDGLGPEMIVSCIKKFITLLERDDIPEKTIVLDFSGSSEAHIELCMMCSRIFLVKRNDCVSEATVLQFERECKVISEAVLEKVQKVSVSVVKEQLGEKFLDLNVDGELGISIKSILQKEGLLDGGA